jgi:hypothetical protein
MSHTLYYVRVTVNFFMAIKLASVHSTPALISLSIGSPGLYFAHVVDDLLHGLYVRA